LVYCHQSLVFQRTLEPKQSILKSRLSTTKNWRLTMKIWHQKRTTLSFLSLLTFWFNDKFMVLLTLPSNIFQIELQAGTWWQKPKSEFIKKNILKQLKPSINF
jgi:hypothetical protein